MSWSIPTSLTNIFTKPLKHHLSDAPIDEPSSKRWKHVDSTEISPDQQLVPLINRRETAAELLAVNLQRTAPHDVGDDDGDEFADAEEGLANGAPDDLQTQIALPRHVNSEPLPVNHNIATDEPTEHEVQNECNKPYEILHEDFDQVAIPDEQFRSDGYHAEYIENEQQQPYNQTSEQEVGTFGATELGFGNTVLPSSSDQDEQTPEQQLQEDHDTEQWPAGTFTDNALQIALDQQESFMAPDYDYGDIGIPSPSRQAYDQLGQESPFAQEQPDHDYATDEQLQQLGILDAGEQEPDAAGPILISDDEHDEEDAEEDLFASAFGKTAAAQADDDDDEDNDSDLEIIEVAQPTKTVAPSQRRSNFSPPQDQTTANIQERIAIPPFPGSEPQSTTSINKTNQPTPKLHIPKPARPERPPHPYGSLIWDGRIRPGPDIDRDLSKSLSGHWRFHKRVLAQVSKLKNFEAYDLDRRYLIGVLPINGKKATAVSCEKDMFWMYGNKFSTVRTVWEKYWERAFDADKEECVMLMGYEMVDMEDQMQELDYFNDKLCVFRFAKKGTEGAKGKKFDEGFPIYHHEPEVVVIDDD